MSKTLALSIATLGTKKNGAIRLWLEGRRLSKAGFTPAKQFKMTINEKTKQIILTIDKAGERMVSKRNRTGSETPIIDITSMNSFKPIAEVQKLKVAYKENMIIITPSETEMRKLSRNKRLKEKLERKIPLAAGSVSTGLGILSYAIHEGLKKAGIKSTLEFSIEIDEKYQDIATERNPCWNENTVNIAMPLQEIAFDKQAQENINEVDILEAGIPCTAHSLAGRAKKHLRLPEDDPAAGHLVAGFLAVVAIANPSILLVENVPSYAKSASFSILTNQLKEWGYDIEWGILDSSKYGSIEKRKRMAMIAISQGLTGKELLFAQEMPKYTPVKISSIMENIPDDSKLWSEMKYLKEKEITDAASGKGFKMQICDPEDHVMGTIGRGYAKIRSTEPKFAHPTNKKMLRQLTPAEHARAKGISEDMIKGLSATTAHEMLGQSIVVEPFRELGKNIGLKILRKLPPGKLRQPKISENHEAINAPKASKINENQMSLFE